MDYGLTSQRLAFLHPVRIISLSYLSGSNHSVPQPT
jgi:hypothetical protein